MFIETMFHSVLYYTVFTICVSADDNVTRRWSLRIREQIPKDRTIYEQRNPNRASTLVGGKMINDKDLNETLLCDSPVYTAIRTSASIWRCIYQVIIISAVFILSVFSKKLAGSKTDRAEVFKKRNRFVEEIEEIKRWGHSVKPNVIVEQDWKIDWTSDIWLGRDNDVESASSVLIHYKKTQVRTLEDQWYNKR